MFKWKCTPCNLFNSNIVHHLAKCWTAVPSFLAVQNRKKSPVSWWKKRLGPISLLCSEIKIPQWGFLINSKDISLVWQWTFLVSCTMLAKIFSLWPWMKKIQIWNCRSRRKSVQSSFPFVCYSFLKSNIFTSWCLYTQLRLRFSQLHMNSALLPWSIVQLFLNLHDSWASFHPVY